MSIADKTIKAVRVSVMATLLSGLLQVGTTVIMARLLTPAEYGLVAGALVLVAPLSMILFGGLERALVLQDTLPETALDAVFWGSLGLAGLGAIGLAGLAGLGLAGFYQGQLAGILLACTPLLAGSALAALYRALLRRHFAFGRLAAADLASQFLGPGLVAILAAVQGWGAYAIVAGMLAQSAVQTLLLAWFAGHQPHWRLNLPAAHPILRASLSLSGTSVLEVVHARLPAAIIGLGLGEVALGLFNRAYLLVQLPLEVPATTVTKVLFGGLAQWRHDLDRLRRAAAALVETGAAVVLPVCAGMALAAPELVATLLGPQWDAAVPLIPWLCLGGAAAMIGHFFAMLNEAALRLRERFRIQCFTLLVSGAALLLAVRFDLRAAAAAAALGALLFLLLHVRLAVHVLHIAPGKILLWLLPGAVAALACAGALLALRPLLPGELAAPWRLGLDIAACGLCLPLVYGLLFRRLLADLWRYAGLPSRAATDRGSRNQ
ncbi:oligosaccharide flippase family protein [Ferrovibrio sp.]|uniref:oligosaccharide flippase family protein n=1 Tax=Ferrovibrio sp. TaxID=1917215 RepID=UPI001B6B5263|nr:oligosaccharide flippase family protein [Ferrovibrio sp.]MBP7062949.1 oligosaccharide flippase family protein [Ferrovibrio sp.]